MTMQGAMILMVEDDPEISRLVAEVLREGFEIEISETGAAEFDLLACFVQRPRRVLTRDQILDWTRGRSVEPFDRTIDMLISRLRKKLGAASPGSSLISTVRNGGYLFTATVERVSS
jgi:two-component system OmpR family response regulator